MKHRELWWLLVVIGVVAVGFYRAGKADAPEPAPSSSAVASPASAPAPSGEVPRFRGPLSRAQFSFEEVQPYSDSPSGFRFRIRGTKDGAAVTAELRLNERTVKHEDLRLSAEAWRAFFDRLEARGVWTLRSSDVNAHRDQAHYEVYVQAADWTHRAVFCDTGEDLHASAFLAQGLAGTVLSEQYESLEKAIFPDHPELIQGWLPRSQVRRSPSTPEPSATPIER